MSLSEDRAGRWLQLDPAKILLDEISHRVLNDYSRTIAMLRLAANRIDDVSTRGVLLDAAQSLLARAEAHRVLRPLWRPEHIDLGDYMEQVCAAISAASLADAGIKLTLVRVSALIPADRCWRLGLIVTELVTNSARHGLEWKSGEVRIELSASPAEVSCTVADNGRSAVGPAAGRGTHIVSSLAAELGGRVDWFFRPCGVAAVVRMPLLGGAAYPT